MRFTKTLLKAGTYHSPDGTVEVTPDRLRHWRDQFRKMRDNRQIIPVDWDHSADASALQPLSLADYERKRSAKNTVGHLADFSVASDGQSAEIVLDVLDDKAIQAAEKNLVQVSPVLFPHWKDGAANEYHDCITHVDFVNHAVDHSQSGFKSSEQPAIACALRMGLATHVHTLTGVTRMAEDKPEDDKAEEETPPEGAEASGDSEVGNSKDAMLKACVGELAAMNIVLTEGTTIDNFFERLHSALLTAKAHRTETEAKNGAAEQQAGPGSDSDVVQDTGVALMSLQAQAVFKHSQEQHRKQLLQRMDALFNSGRCKPDEAKARKPEAEALRLSLTKDGEHVKGDLEKWLDDRETLPRGTFWTDQQKTRMSAESVVDPPANMRGELTNDETADLANWALGRQKAEKAK